MLAKAELNVAQHTAYHDSCNNFVSWLRTGREKLATCSDTFGEKSTIVGKIERAKVIKNFFFTLKYVNLIATDDTFSDSIISPHKRPLYEVEDDTLLSLKF